MTGTVARCDIVGKAIIRVLTIESVDSQTNLVFVRCFVEIHGGWLSIDESGADFAAPLRWCDPYAEKGVRLESFTELWGRRITHIVVSELLPAYAVILDGFLLLTCSDLGPPFSAFGPQVHHVGEFFKWDDLRDFWTRSPVTAFSK